MVDDLPDLADGLRRLHDALVVRAEEIALHLVYERPSQVMARPSLARVYFAERCASEEQLSQMLDAFRSVGLYTEVYEGEIPFLAAAAGGQFARLQRPVHVVYNGIGFGVTNGGYEPGRIALLPAVTDAYGLISTNSDAYTCALALHRFHSFVLLRALGVPIPPVWHYRVGRGWMGERPPRGVKVIVKSTYEAWSVGVRDGSVFRVDESCEERVAAIADEIGQPVTLQQFVSGPEVCVPILAFPNPVAMPPVEQILKAKSGGDAVMTIDDNLTRGAVEYVPYDGAASTMATMRGIALQVFDIFQQRAVGRMDFRIDAEGRPWLTDAAVVPGLSQASSMFASLRSLGLDHPTFLRTVIAASLAARGALRT